MALIEWEDNLSTGVPEMDEEHKLLINMLNSVYEMLRKGEREKACNYFISTLMEYVETHLTHEEEFMERIGYPELERHKKAHEIFKREISKLCDPVKEGDPHEFATALSMCWGWLFSHIQKTDRKYGEYYKSMQLRDAKQDVM